MTQIYEQSVSARIEHEKLASEFIKAISDLFYDKGVETVLFRNQVIDKRPSEILNLHDYACRFVGRTIAIEDTVEILKEIVNLDICPARVDIGRLGAEWTAEGVAYKSKADFVADKLSEFIGLGDTLVKEDASPSLVYQRVYPLSFLYHIASVIPSPFQSPTTGRSPTVTSGVSSG